MCPAAWILVGYRCNQVDSREEPPQCVKMLDWKGMVDNLNEKENEGETDESEKVEWS